MGKGLSRVSTCRQSRCLHTVARQRRTELWSPDTKIRPGIKPASTTAHLIDAGYVSQSNAGVYHYLPLALRVRGKIEALVDKHMRSIGASRIALSSLSNQRLWSQSGRLDAGGELFKFSDRGKTDWLLAPTHEEEITTLMKHFGLGNLTNGHYARLYQIGPKYRDELRPRGGLLRGKEFIMKDLYTFDPDVAAALSTYAEVRAAYRNFFSELGLPFIEASADSGNMGGNLSHEYHFPDEQGEDTIITCSSCGVSRNIEYVPTLELTVTRLPRIRSSKDSRMKSSSFTNRDFISDDKSSLIRVLLPAKDESGNEVGDIRNKVNTHVVKAALRGITDVSTGIEEEAAQRIFSSMATSGSKSTSRSIFYLLDKRLSSNDLAHALEQDGIPDDVEVWAVQPSSQDAAAQLGIDTILPQNGDKCASCHQGRLKTESSIEIGHTFHLGSRYSSQFGLGTRLKEKSNATDGKSTIVYAEMGCHGIGVSRLIAAAARLVPPSKNGKDTSWSLQWPKTIAPYHVSLLARSSTGLDDAMTKLYDNLSSFQDGSEPIDVLLDDRSDASIAFKVKEAIFLGIPIQVIQPHDSLGYYGVRCSRLDVAQDVHVDDLRLFLSDLLHQL